jgi:hypothetical protein
MSKPMSNGNGVSNTNGHRWNGNKMNADDDDLKDLLGKKEQHQNTTSALPHQPSFTSLVIGTLNYHVHTCCFFYPVTCGILTIGSFAIAMWLLLGSILNPVEEFGIIKHDHSNIQSKFDLKMQDIEHWCLGGGDDSCTCEDPLIPLPRSDHSSWILAYKGNRKNIDHFVDASKNPDVAFLGGSIGKKNTGV